MSAINFHLYLNRDGCKTWSICNTSYDSFWSQFMPEEISFDLYSAMLLVIGEILNQLSWGISRCCCFFHQWVEVSECLTHPSNPPPCTPEACHDVRKRQGVGGKLLIFHQTGFLMIVLTCLKSWPIWGGRISPNPTLPSPYFFCLGNTYVSVVKRHPMCSYVPWRWNHHSLMWTLRCWEFTNQAGDNWDFS